MKFAMTDKEIKDNFANASNPPKEQIKVLAELNNVTMSEMAAKAKELGLLHPDTDLRSFNGNEQKRKKVEKIETPETPDMGEIARLKDALECKDEALRAMDDMLSKANNTIDLLQAKLGIADKYKKVIRILMED